MKFHVITLFPELFSGFLTESIIGRAINDKKIQVNFINPRTYVTGKYKKIWPDGNVMLNIDGRPFGGGPGMVMRAEPIIKSIEVILQKIEKENEKIVKKNAIVKTKAKKLKKRSAKIIFFSPGGELFTNDYAAKTVDKFSDVIFICGRYEGVDARVYQVFKRVEHISIGNYVLTGGELPAMVCIDAMSRQKSFQ
jgi:tRNA (guanine37-N1)-methyltransferase